MTNRANPRLKKAAALAALTLALSLPASGILAASTFEAHYTTASVTAQEQIAGNLLNLDRSNYNLAELTIDPALSRIARLKSEDMRDNRYFAVERLIRHAVESVMDAFGVRRVYGFFGNSIDPIRGKPTNAEMIGMLAQYMRVTPED